MNFLWLMYFGDAVQAVSVGCVIFAVLLVIGYGIWALFAAMEDMDRKPPAKMFWGAAALVIIASLIPSQRVFYAAAAMSAGKQAASTGTGEKAIRALNAWLDRQAQPEQSK